MMAGDEPVALEGVTVQGDLDLRVLRQVTSPFRCQSCRFTGAFVATDLIFERIVDLRGSTFEGPVELSAAIFEDRAGFEEAEFGGTTGFALARFLAGASFSGSDFAQTAEFERALFGGDALFADATFGSDVSFEAAQFDEGADFTGAGFTADNNFAAADFSERASFRRADFGRHADLRGANMAAGADLGVNEFREGFRLDGVTAAGSIAFAGATLRGVGFLNNLSSTGSLVLDGMLLAPDAELHMEGMAVDRLFMDVERQIDFVQGTTKIEVLELVERTGRESGNLALANRARFALLDLRGGRKEGLDRLVDRVFFRNMGGYLVRPLNPLLTLFSLILAGGLIRSARAVSASMNAWWRDHAGKRRSLTPRQWLGRVLLILEKTTARLLSGIAAAMRAAFKPKPEHIELQDPERTREYGRVGVLWCEFLAYKLAIATFLLALGNSNSTIRQLLDAVLS